MFPASAVIVIVVAIDHRILAALYAFQQDDWRRLLSFSSAENAAIAVALLGARLLFRARRPEGSCRACLDGGAAASAGHALAKGGMFLTGGRRLRGDRGYLSARASGAANVDWLSASERCLPR